MNGDGWMGTVRQFGRWFKTAAGLRDSLRASGRAKRQRVASGPEGRRPRISIIRCPMDDRAKPIIIDDDLAIPLGNQLGFALLVSSPNV